MTGDAIERPEGFKARQSHAAHCTFAKSIAAAAEVSNVANDVHCAPSASLDAESPEVLAKLEALDDAVFGAIQGRAVALAELLRLWPALKGELGEPLLVESREQYIRYALSVWCEPTTIDGSHYSARAVNALEVLCVLLDEAS